MKKYLALLLLIPNLTFAITGYVGSGFENSNFNVTYCPAGTEDGTTYYTSTTTYYLNSGDGGVRWFMNNGTYGGDGGTRADDWDYLALPSNTATQPPSYFNGLWIRQPYPTGSAGVFSTTTTLCGSDPVATTTATTTASLVDIAFGQAIQITLLFLVVIGLFYNTMTEKRKK